jgi:predicted N-acyltransferase
VTVERGGQLQAACALYLKSHSYGEYVFDWAWADAYRRHGLAYYPKLLGAVPFTPVPGTPPAGAIDDDGATAAGSLASWPGQGRVVGTRAVHRRADRAAFAAPAGCCARACSSTGRRTPRSPQSDFTDLLARLQRDKRKKIQQERRAWPSRPASASPCTRARSTTALWTSSTAATR